MNLKNFVFSTVGVLGALTVCAGDAPLAESAVKTAVLDTYAPHLVKDPAASHAVTYFKGDTVTVIAPDGSSSVLVDAGTAAGTAAGTTSWAPSVGGLWTFVNSQQGTTTVTVRHFNRGAGTASAPARIVDDEELVDLVETDAIGSGYVFRLDGYATLLDALSVPAGFMVRQQGTETYELVTSPDGRLSPACPAVSTYFDTETAGPNRKVYVKETVPLAFSGDAWRLRASDASATLTVTSPSGTQTETALTGTGVTPFYAEETGIWTVTLTAGAESWTAALMLRGKGTHIIVR